MKKQSYLNLLIFCAVLKQGISDSVDENTDESTDVHIRRKRVIRLDKDGRDEGRPVSLASVPYIVNIQINNMTVCPGTILSAIYVLVLRSCVYPIRLYGYTQYTILSGSATRNHGTPHTVRRRLVVQPNREIALVEASPPFDFQESPNRPISLFLGALPDIAYGIFSSWGCTQPGSLFHQQVYPAELMQARLPIIPLAECIHIYRQRERITEQNICTLDETKRRGTCHGDQGGPLAVQFSPLEAHHLIGVSLFRGKNFGKDPDVFVNLNHQVLNQWIMETIQH